MNNLQAKSSVKEAKKPTQLTEKRIREIVREEIRKYHIEEAKMLGEYPPTPF